VLGGSSGGGRWRLRVYPMYLNHIRCLRGLFVLTLLGDPLYTVYADWFGRFEELGGNAPFWILPPKLQRPANSGVLVKIASGSFHSHLPPPTLANIIHIQRQPSSGPQFHRVSLRRKTRHPRQCAETRQRHEPPDLS